MSTSNNEESKNMMQQMVEKKVQNQLQSMLQVFAGVGKTQSDELSQNLSKEALSEAQEQVDRIEKLRVELVDDISSVEEAMSKIKDKIRSNQQSEAN